MNEVEKLRIDVWLWRARFLKTRALATEFVTTKGARIEHNGQVRRTTKASSNVQAGDLVSFSTSAASFVIEILTLPDRRGPASEASETYRTVEKLDQKRAIGRTDGPDPAAFADRTPDDWRPKRRKYAKR